MRIIILSNLPIVSTAFKQCLYERDWLLQAWCGSLPNVPWWEHHLNKQTNKCVIINASGSLSLKPLSTLNEQHMLISDRNLCRIILYLLNLIGIQYQRIIFSWRPLEHTDQNVEVFKHWFFWEQPHLMTRFITWYLHKPHL